MEIRRASPGDAERLTGIAHAAKRHWGYSEDLMRLWRAELTVTPDFVADHPTYAAVEGADIVGFYALSAAADVFEVEHFWVAPGHMRRGIGAMLFRHAVDVVRSLRGTTLEIASDPNAEGFYVRMGARRVGQVDASPAGRVLPFLVLDVVK